MQFHVGTSGFSYKEWKGIFYPEKIRPDQMLEFYARHFSTVEMNNTFYRMPEIDAVKTWAKQVPAEFQFVLKAPQRITHIKRLKEVEAETKEFITASAALKKQRGPLLFQLPPNFKKDLPRLKDFLKLLRGKKVAFEFRHESWLDDEVYELLKSKSYALCLADAEELPATKLIETTNWGYIRLRREKYTDAQLRSWIKKLKAQAWNEAYVFFKHEDTGTGPKFAGRFLEMI